MFLVFFYIHRATSEVVVLSDDDSPDTCASTSSPPPKKTEVCLSPSHFFYKINVLSLQLLHVGMKQLLCPYFKVFFPEGFVYYYYCLLFTFILYNFVIFSYIYDWLGRGCNWQFSKYYLPCYTQLTIINIGKGWSKYQDLPVVMFYHLITEFVLRKYLQEPQETFFRWRNTEEKHNVPWYELVFIQFSFFQILPKNTKGNFRCLLCIPPVSTGLADK